MVDIVKRLFDITQDAVGQARQAYLQAWRLARALDEEEARSIQPPAAFRRWNLTPYEAIQNRGVIDQVGRTLERVMRMTDERMQIPALLSALESLDSFLLPSDKKLMAAAERYLQTLKERKPSRNDLEAFSPAKAAKLDPELVESYLLPPDEMEFSPQDQRILARLAQGRFESPADYQLNLAAHHLSLVNGFEELLCLPLLYGVEQYPFQINTAKQVLRAMRGRALLCDEVGLGKTIEAGLILKEYFVRGLARRTLILTPPALTSQWQEEMRGKFDADFITHDDPDFRKFGSEAWERFDRVVASIHTAKLAPHRDVIARLPYDLLIVDEAHHLKNRSSVNWKFVNGIKSKYLLLLTATPVQNNLDELFNLITLLSPGQLKTLTAFRRAFVESGDPRKPKNRGKLQELLMDVMIRNTRSQVNVVLPPRRAYTLRVEFSPEERALYDATTEWVRRLYRDKGVERLMVQTLQAEAGSSVQALRATLETMRERDDDRRSFLETLCQLAGTVRQSAKGDALLRLMRQRPEKILVFTRFRETLHFLRNLMNKEGVAHSYFSGEMSRAEKDAQIIAFAQERQVMISTDVGSEGRNLQFCHTLVNFDLPWNPMRIEQRVGRVHRIGQTEPVQIFNLTARETVEDYILEVLDGKINMFELVVGEVGEILGNLEEERDFEEIAFDLWAGSESNEAATKGFAQLGEQLVKARRRYQETKAYDEALFGEDFVAEN